jgi:hypothetical protein
MQNSIHMRFVSGYAFRHTVQCLIAPSGAGSSYSFIEARTSMLLRSLTFSLCVLAASVAVHAQSTTPLAQTLTGSEKTLIEAKKKDTAASFKPILAENFSLVGVDGTLHEKQEAIDELGDSGLLELTPYNIKVVAVTDDAAIVTYDAIVRKAPEEDQGPPPRYQHFSSVWVKQGDQWRLKFHQATAAHWGDW